MLKGQRVLLRPITVTLFIGLLDICQAIICAGSLDGCWVVAIYHRGVGHLKLLFLQHWLKDTSFDWQANLRSECPCGRCCAVIVSPASGLEVACYAKIR
jgi:hypothetical protein